MNWLGLTLLFLVAALAAGLLAGGAAANVELEYFNALSGPDSVTLEWKTASELDNMGFNLYRSETSSFGDALQLNTQLIPSQVGGQPIGAYYEWPDQNVSLNVLYTYWLESVDLFGGTVLHDPDQAAASGGNIIPTPGPGSSATATSRPATPSAASATPTSRAATPVPLATTNQAGTPTRVATPPPASPSPAPGPAENASGGATGSSSGPPNAAAGGSLSPTGQAEQSPAGQVASPGAVSTPGAIPAGPGAIALNASGVPAGDALSAAQPIGQSRATLESSPTEESDAAVLAIRSIALRQVMTILLVAAVVLAIGSVAAFLITRRQFE